MKPSLLSTASQDKVGGALPRRASDGSANAPVLYILASWVHTNLHGCMHTHIAIPCSHTTNFARSPIEIVSNDPGSRDRSDTGTRKEAAKRKKGKTGGANVPSSGPRVYVCVHCAVDDDTVNHHSNKINNDDDRPSGGFYRQSVQRSIRDFVFSLYARG
ncbi:uncharacterized protein K489DRAFT_46872 [Dissoconium aciculare CBS 342.82]|uniref:Uncharacterized protein n=1 Tax=Dissoconium aciculare CBS 342.82 TaxID=1314786 RepID=A0A6J3LZP9_9PEZI|nr:uncharacterized protein K489DRAFT_46872 [Dissoconium aciculare CBS 342.82]KAF1820107.1 hypothetical protein K489DRAFT_46872 [Dissoconium aciculare CBS 342.82]